MREALLELSRGGLVEPMRNRGFKVVEPTLTELRNLFDMREVLELHAAVLVAANPPRDFADGARMRRPDREGGRDRRRAALSGSRSQLSSRLHRRGRHDLLTETVMGLRDKMRLYGISSRARAWSGNRPPSPSTTG